MCVSGSQLTWLVLILGVTIVACNDTPFFFEDYVDDDMAEYIPAVVTQHTDVHRRRRSVMEPEYSGGISHWYDFPESMSFTVRLPGSDFKLNLTRNEYARSAVTISDQNGQLETEYETRFGVYYSVEQGSSVLVECERNECFLYGTVTVKGVQYHIEQDYSSANLALHTLRHKNTPNMENMIKSMMNLPADDDDETKVAATLQGNIRKRRSIPNCDIIEVKALIDDTIWLYYMDKNGDDETKATEEIYKYFTSTFAEVDFRLECLTTYFQDYNGCEVDCLRVILVDIMITKTSSWTDNHFLSGTNFVRGNDGMTTCGNINLDLPGSSTDWDQLLCFTRENMVFYEGGSWKDLFRTVAQTNSMCNSNIRKRVSVHEALGDGVDIQIAHSLLYSLNGPKDKTQSCSPNGWYLMREPQSEKPTNPAHYGDDWYLSDCTVGPICSYVKGLSTNCMRVHSSFNHSTWATWESEPLPGEIFTTDEQCQVRWGNDSVQCDPTGGGDLYPPDLCGKYMYCTSNGNCVCKVRVSSGTPCSPCARTCMKGECKLIPDVLLGDNCECHSQCEGNNTVCEPGLDDCGTCQCKDGYYEDDGACLPKVPNGGDCDEDEQCEDPNAICVNSTCQCMDGYYDLNGVCKKKSCLGGPCNDTSQCKGDNVVCDLPDVKICVCDTLYYPNITGECVPFPGDVCDPCIPSPETCTAPNTVCGPDNFCICSNNTVEVDGACYGTNVGDPCSDAVDTCIDDNAECDEVCVCSYGYVWNGSICVGCELCEPCDPSSSTCKSHLVCSSERHRCECPSDEVQVGDDCYGTRVTDTCTNDLDTCVDDNAECNGTLCVCIDGFVWTGTICVGAELCDPCDPGTPSCDTQFVCDPATFVCQCLPDQVQVMDMCYGTHVTEPCTPVLDTCVDDNAECNGLVCDCIGGFVWNGSICVGQDYCDPCDPGTPTCSSGLICNVDLNRCDCPPGEVAIDGQCYGTRVTDDCTSVLDTCIDDNAACNGTTCQCLSGFMWNGSICVGPDLCDPCDPNTPSCATGLVCNTDRYRCECPDDRVQIDDGCYGTEIGEPCTNTLDTCIDDNAMCNGMLCECLPGYLWNGSLCVGSDICEPCDESALLCDTGLVCSPDTQTCECPPNQVQIDGMCYGTTVGDPCTNILDTCIDDNAECNGIVCECISPFIWNGSICVGPALCDPCDPATPSCSSDLVCDPDLNVCSCPPGKVQVGTICVGTHHGDDCVQDTDTCVDDNSECNSLTDTCDCISGYQWNGTICVGSDLCDPCDSGTLSCDTGLVCSSSTDRCQCPPDEVQINNQCYGTHINDPCTNVLDTCIDDNAGCNGALCACLPGYSWNGSICVGSELCDPCDVSTLGCNTGLVCGPETDRCECPADRVQVGDMCYGRLIGEPCTTSTDTCIDDNAACGGGICQCLVGYAWNGTICVGSDLCEPCDEDTLSCDSGLVCSPDTNTCECPSDEVQIGGACYGTLITEPCTNLLDTCIDDNAECNGFTCECIAGFLWNGSICIGQEVCDPCDPSAGFCGAGLICSESTYTCQCPTDEVQIGNLCYGTRIGEPCTTTLDTCIDDNAVCNGAFCVCNPGFIWNGSICVGPDLCDPCDPNTASCSTGLVCGPDTNWCECPPGQVQIGGDCYGTTVGDLCTPLLDTCIDNDAICNGFVCVCVPGHAWNGSVCVGSELCDLCDTNTLSCDTGLVCGSVLNRCQCPTSQVQIDSQCYGTVVGEPCTTSLDTCVDDNAECNGALCACITGFAWNGSLCVGSELCDTCDDSTLSCDSDLVCGSDTDRCECPADRVQIGSICVGRLVNEPCSPVLDTCIDDNAECNGVTCACITGFTWNGSICVGSDLCEPCDPLSPTCATDLVCNPETNTCECPPDEVQIEDECYGTRVNEPCTSALDTCIDDNAACNGVVCECIPGFAWNGSHCVGNTLCDPCDDSTLPCDPDLVCGDTGRCECPADRVQIGDECYGTRVNEVCTPVLDTCIDDNAECNGVVCACITGFAWNGSICVGSDLCDPCDPLTASCSSDLVCSSDTYRCECPSDEVQIADACYGTRIGEVCTTTLDTCIDDRAACIGSICNCLPGYTWNGIICEGLSIDDPCINDTCSGVLVCNPNTSLCACPDDLVRIGNDCYGTLIGEVCLPALDTCIDDNAMCNGAVCECIAGFVWNGSICVGPNLCDPCDPDTPSCDTSLVCSSDTYRCECPTDQVQIGDICVGTRVNQPCSNVLDTCIDDNAACDGSQCSCLPGYAWNGSICVGSELCDPCDTGTLSCDTDLVCSSDTDTCQCPPDRVQVEDVCVGTLINEECTNTLDTCIDDNAGCNGAFCACLPTYTWNGSICVGQDLCDPCDPSASTCGSGLVCSPETETCACPQVTIVATCYGTRIGESCNTALDTCVDDNAFCDGGTCDCLPGFVWNGSICVGDDLCDPCDASVLSCAGNLVCDDDTDTCKCPPDRVQIENACYGRLVAEPCTTSLDTCIDDNAECNGAVCACITGFIWNGSICVGPDLCDPCDPDTTSCNTGLVCNPDTNTCDCPTGEVQIDGDCYGRFVGESCTTSLDTCVDDNAECNGGVCQCIAGFSWNGSLCVGPDLCDPCDPSAVSCTSDLVCASVGGVSRCQCPSDEVQIGDACYGTDVTDPCNPALDTCVDDNAECNGAVCACITGYAWNGSICVGSDLCDPCDDNTLACDTGLVCSSDTDRCECPPDRGQVGDECVGTRVGEPCSTTLDTCVDHFAACVGSVCSCIPGFSWNGSQCVGSDLCDPCDSSSCGSLLVCGPTTGLCECPDGFVQIGNACYGTRLDDPCTNSLDTCIDDNAECNNVVCVCSTGFTQINSVCYGSELCEPCLTTNSTCDTDLVCSPNTDRCECPPGEVQIGDECYGTNVGEPCTTATDTCVDDNAECNGALCQCMTGFIWNGSLCVGSDLCDPCDPDTVSCGSPLVCSPDTNVCECPPGSAQVGDVCVGTRVNEPCVNVVDTCIDDNAACNGASCQCLPGYAWNGSICVGSDLCDPCDDNTLACDTGLACGPDTDRCECPADRVQVGDMCYGRLVGEPCTSSLDTCVDDNAMCNGLVCACMPGFLWNGSLCVGSNLCDPCDDSTLPCSSGLVCDSDSDTCECPDDEVQIGDDCYGTRINDPCTNTLDTCIDDNAMCNGVVCACMPGFTWNGSICVGQELCDPCDPLASTCSAPLDCSSDTFTCQCPPGQVQIGDDCYGTTVGDDCTNSLDTCIDDNAECNGATCVCVSGFVWNGSLCAGSEICDTCDPSAQPCGAGLICNPDTDRCSCPLDRVEIDGVCYGREVGDPCTDTLDTCIDDNAVCNGALCTCSVGFVWNGSICVGSELCDPCDSVAQACDSGLQCDPDTDTCQCPSDSVQIEDQCYGTRVTEPCTNVLDTCIDDNAECDGTVCTCISGFTWNGSRCVGTGLCDPCDDTILECSSPFTCGASTSRCECPPDRVQVLDFCWGRLIGEVCTTNFDTCIDDNAQCSGPFGVCECISQFAYNPLLGICVGSSLDDPCDAISCSTGLICGPTGRCECLSPPLQINAQCYGTRVTEPCRPDVDTCVDDNAFCDTDTCQCVSGFVWNGVICVGSELDDPCDDSPQSCASNGLVCGPTGRCECPGNQVQIDNTCVSLACASCVDDSDCLGDLVCNSGSCECASGFYLDNCSECQPKISNGNPCQSDEQCESGICLCDICEATIDDDCCDDCDDIRADIVIVTDNSGSVGAADYLLEKTFAINLANAFTISTTDTRLGVVDYSTQVHNDNTFNMNVFSSNLDLTAAIASNGYKGGFTRTDLALERATTFFNSGANRDDVLNFVIVLTDGNTNNGGEGAPLIAAANALKAIDDMTVYAVGIGTGVSLAELQLIASDPSNVYQTTDFDTLNSITVDLLDAICSAA